jgi:hypothetical protein
MQKHNLEQAAIMRRHDGRLKDAGALAGGMATVGRCWLNR